MRRQAAFLAAAGGRGPFDLADGTMVVVPSLTLPTDELKDVLGIQYYEERLLFLLLTLREPGVRLVFLSSTDIDPEILDYYLRFLPDPADARRRLVLSPLHDARQIPLTTKTLQHPEVIDGIRELVAHDPRVYLLPFNVTPQEEELGARLGVPIYGTASATAYLGGKSGGRIAARAAGVPVVEGVENVHTADDVQKAFAALGAQTPDRAVLKLNDSFSGMGNAIVRARPGGDDVKIASGLWAALPDGVRSWEDYARRLRERGGVVERMVPGPIDSPSVQLLIKPGREPEVVSTHDQILGGLESQVYVGCEFPARPAYRDAIVEHARRIAAVLAERGVVGHFGIDFLVSHTERQIYFGEINLRLGGTTHPFGLARLLTGAAYDQRRGVLVDAQGADFYYVASDNVQGDRLVGRPPAAVLKVLSAAGLLYDRARRSGVTLHQMGSLAQSGKLGLCSIAESPKEARIGFQNAVGELLRDDS
ncbi:MAG: ATP-grasp domain-containing protein [Hamadaea sp.]|uniref:peptide ligase PGM1-related protein n=1 Tax=Hamadaea sp. TaxID=2024425 RepID=UPI001837B080|nr:peptide ligase PGM1-related protein [Hamadaea sp.]NUR73097.1 ATP-grasp domain-containing protein [Hamadaea sp.]NUT23009.1 ATP-grasp domain-containing protein [Hamadaea sp.]